MQTYNHAGQLIRQLQGHSESVDAIVVRDHLVFSGTWLAEYTEKKPLISCSLVEFLDLSHTMQRSILARLSGGYDRTVQVFDSSVSESAVSATRHSGDVTHVAAIQTHVRFKGIQHAKLINVGYLPYNAVLGSLVRTGLLKRFHRDI